MKTFIMKYLVLVWTLGIGAANFIACGSQMYQVSIKDDFDQAQAATINPEVNDKNSTVYGIHATEGWKELPIHYRYGKQLDAEQVNHLKAAMKMWEIATGKNLFTPMGVHQNITGDNFKDLYSSLDDNINGHYLDDNWKKTKKPDEVLATTIWSVAANPNSIATADIRFNNHGYIIGDSLKRESTEDKEVVDMQTLALHELGHLLGLAHVDQDVDPYSIMNPTLYIGEGLTARELSDADIERIQTIYGCEGESCDLASVKTKIAEFQKAMLGDEATALAH